MSYEPKKVPSDLTKEQLETIVSGIQKKMYLNPSGSWEITIQSTPEQIGTYVTEIIDTNELETYEVVKQYDVSAYLLVSASSAEEARAIAETTPVSEWDLMSVVEMGSEVEPPVEPPVTELSGTMFPPDAPIYMRVDSLPVHSNSDNYINKLGGSSHTLSPNFSSLWEWPLDQNPPSWPGLFFYTIDGTKQPLVPVRIVPAEVYPDLIPWEIRESDLDENGRGMLPLPLDAKVEFEKDPDGDHHLLILDTANKKLYEMWRARRANIDGVEGWDAQQVTIWNLLKGLPQRDLGRTSADGAGLPILPLIIRQEEIEAGEINHCIRMTSSSSSKGFINPATHFCGNTSGEPPMGLRLRLKANFDISKFDPKTQVILKAMKFYGCIIADNGNDGSIEAGPPSDTYWRVIGPELETIAMSNFEVVDTGDPVLSIEY